MHAFDLVPVRKSGAYSNSLAEILVILGINYESHTEFISFYFSGFLFFEYFFMISLFLLEN